VQVLNSILRLQRFYNVAICILVAIMAGCAGQGIYPKLNQALRSGDCGAAAAIMADGREAYGGNSQLLYLLDAAMVALRCADYPLAQQHLRAAEQLAEKLWTESLSRNVAAFVANDYTLAYGGEDYERVMIHLVSAIGYLQMDQLDEALVEVRRLDSLLSVFSEKYREDDVYKKDAFGRYLSGMLHEADGAYDDAFIDYSQAAGIYQNEWLAYGTPLPEMLRQDLLRLAVTVDRMEDARRVVSDPVADSWKGGGLDPAAGKVVVIVFNGEGPHKIQDIAVVPTRGGPISIAFPKIVIGAPACRQGTLALAGESGSQQAVLSVVSDINRIAQKSLADRQGRIVAKAVARAVAKQVVIHGIANTTESKEQKQAVAMLLNIANMLALERADTRCWRTLPGTILMGRAVVMPGEYRLQLEMCNFPARDFGTIEVAAGQTRFLFWDTHFNGPR
jgi:hypothetical protein